MNPMILTPHPSYLVIALIMAAIVDLCLKSLSHANHMDGSRGREGGSLIDRHVESMNAKCSTCVFFEGLWSFSSSKLDPVLKFQVRSSCCGIGPLLLRTMLEPIPHCYCYKASFQTAVTLHWEIQRKSKELNVGYSYDSFNAKMLSKIYSFMNKALESGFQVSPENSGLGKGRALLGLSRAEVLLSFLHGPGRCTSCDQKMALGHCIHVQCLNHPTLLTVISSLSYCPLSNNCNASMGNSMQVREKEIIQS
ncbi:hypothetical protein Goari_025473 [Gossypium aridum]|uniref:Uncharacterized protein n=1 Tax=Gossypium aridum TaxID=34290 RepID=A0A7J8X974_GOSAI|nr:hypothetical protein [Gossypium aridum]